ncbi:MAG: alpha-L-rhamnosidase [Planctomycetota bacterium]
MPSSESSRVVLDRPVFAESSDAQWGGIRWPASWVACPGLPSGPKDVWYRLVFTLDAPARCRIHVSADERYDLKLNGRRVGRGPHRGDLRHWCYETYDLDLEAGEHVFLGLVSSPGLAQHLAPSAHLSRTHGLLLAAEGELGPTLATGVADWRAQRIAGLEHLPPTIREARYAGGTQRIDARQYHWPAAEGVGDGWLPVVVGEPAKCHGEPYGELGQVRPLLPSRLPAMMERPFVAGRVRHVTAHADGPVDAAQHLADEAAAWQALLDEQAPVTVAAHQTRSVIIDLENYYCAYPALTTRGGADAELSLDWSEALYAEPDENAPKADRNAIDGLHFFGKGDEFIADGGERAFEPLWWRAGRFVRLRVRTRDEPIEIFGLTWRETRYPLECLPLAEVADDRLARALPVMQRGLLMCMHESYMDTPYYEQLMYVGDTRLDALCTYVVSPDDRLPRRSIELFGDSRIDSGMTQARYPSSTPQIIPSFSLWWIGMLHDLALWRGQRGFIAAQMPAARSVLEAFRRHLDADGLYRSMPGWNFLDWVPGYAFGVPPAGREGVNGAFNWQLVYTLRRAAELEDWLGETQLAERNRQTADALGAAIERSLWNPERALYADDLGAEHFSQHTQCLAVLAGGVDMDRASGLMRHTLDQTDLAPTTIYFSHYLFAALAAAGLGDALSEQLELWRTLPESGFVTPPETPEPSRSDCHAWGSHPLYHLVASVVGLRPASFGFDRVVVRPSLGPLPSIKVTVPHPRGTIVAQLEQAGGEVRGLIALPDGVSGDFVYGDQRVGLAAGANSVTV